MQTSTKRVSLIHTSGKWVCADGNLGISNILSFYHYGALTMSLPVTKKEFKRHEQFKREIAEELGVSPEDLLEVVIE